MDVTVVIVSYNTRALTLATLDSLGACAGDFKLETIVVDNASTDGSADAICSAFPDVTVARSKTNLGFAQAVNLAASQARGRYLLLLNPDTVPDGPYIAELLSFAMANPEHGIYGGRTVREDGSDFLAGYAFPTVWSLVCFTLMLPALARSSAWLNPEEMPGLDRSSPVPVPALSGCLMLIDMELFQRLGGFDPQFFMYGEDADFCYRAHLAGASPTLVPAARIVHLGGKSQAFPSKVEMLWRGKISFATKHSRHPSLDRFLLTAGVFTRAVLRREPWRTVWRTRRAWRDGWPPA